MEDSSQKKTILVLDDTKPVRILLLKRLEKRYRCLLASEPYEALNLLREYFGEIDLIISDFEMPHMNGLEFLKYVHKMTSQIPVIMVSASLNEKRIQELVRLGVRRFVAKPVNLNRLTEEIDALLEADE